MGNYNKMVRGYRMVEREDGVDATEVYTEVDTGGSALPSVVIGSSAFTAQGGSTYAGCIATERERVYEDGDIGTEVVTIRYSSRRGSGGGPGGNIRDTGQQRFDVGCEVVTTDPSKDKLESASNKWKWNTGDDPVLQPINRMVPIGNISIPVIKTTSGAAGTQFQNMIDMVGKINSAVLTGTCLDKLPVGTILFTGASGGTRRNADSNLEWAWEMHFSYRIINTGSFVDTASVGTWNYIFRGDGAANGGWDYPVDASGNKLYASADLGTLLP